MPDLTRHENRLRPKTHTDQRPLQSQSSLRAFFHHTRQLSQVDEDPNSARDLPVSTDISNDVIPLKCLVKIGRDPKEAKRTMSQPNLTKENGSKSGQARLLAAQTAYNEIMATLSTKWEVKDNAKSSSGSKEARRPNGELPMVSHGHHGSRAKSSHSNGQKPSDLAENGKEMNLPYHHMQIPDIPMENLKKSTRRKESSVGEKDRSEASARALQSLKKAMRPVRLQHPNWMQGQLSSGAVSEEDSPARRGEEVLDSDEISEEDDLAEESDRPSRLSESEELDTPDPRLLIDNLWNGYTLKYVKGSTSTPKWSKSSNGQEKRPLQSVHPTNRSAVQKVEKKQTQLRIGHSLLPNVVVQKHAKNEKKTSHDEKISNGRKSAETVSSLASSKSRSIHIDPKNKSTLQSKNQVNDDLSASSDDDSSARTWNIGSPKSAWMELDALQRNQRHLREQIQNHQDQSRSSSSSSASPQPRSSTKSQPMRKSRENEEAVKHRPLASKLRGRSLERYKAERLEKEVSDFAEMRNQFRAHPVPTWIRENKFEQMVEEAEDRKRRVQERAATLLEQTQPFNFSEIPDRHSEKRKRFYANLPNKSTEKQRRPLSSEGIRREDRSQSQRMTQKSHLPMRSFGYTMPRNFCSKHQPPQPSFKPAINTAVPDFSRLHANLDRRQEAYRQERTWTTVPRPFALAEPEVRNDRHEKIPANTKDLQTSNKSNGERHVRRRSKSVTEGFDVLVRPTKAFSLLTAYSKQKIKGENGKGTSNRSAEDRQRAERLRERLLERNAELTDMADLLSQSKQSVPSLDERSREYMEEMAEVKRRLSQRPFIWERSQMDDRRKRIDTRFHEILLEKDADRVFQRALNGS